MNELSIKSTRKLNNGAEMPAIGFGTWKIPDGETAAQCVGWALGAGYRLVDTAAMYKNEKGVGEGIRRSGLARNEIFVTTKVWMTDMGESRAPKAFEKSLKNLGLEYVDLYLIHWPLPVLRKSTWRALEKIYASGRCRAIGVANFTIRHLTELMENSAVVPAVNQVEFHPFLYQKDLLEFCRTKNIQLNAYSPLTHANRLDDARIAAIAQKYGKTNAQIMLRWSMQHEAIPIPKSVHQERILENISVFDFEIGPEDMAAIDALNENHHFIWDSSNL